MQHIVLQSIKTIIKHMAPKKVKIGDKIHDFLEVIDGGISKDHDNRGGHYFEELSTCRLKNLDNILLIQGDDSFDMTVSINHKLKNMFSKNDYLILLPRLHIADDLFFILFNERTKNPHVKFLGHICEEHAKQIYLQKSADANFLIKFRTKEQMILFKLVCGGDKQ